MRPAVRNYLKSFALVLICVIALALFGKFYGEKPPEETTAAVQTKPQETVEPVPSSPAAESSTAAETEPAGPDIPEELIEAGQKDGALTVYGSGSEAYLAAAAEYFEDVYEIRVNYARLPNSEVYTRIKSTGGDPTADVWFEAALDPVTEAEADGLLEGPWCGISYDPYCLLVNTEVLEKAQVPVPESWEDLTGEQYRGMIAMPDPNITGAGRRIVIGLQQLFGQEKGLDLLRAMRRNVVILGERAAEPAERTALGDAGIGIVLFSDALTQLRNGNGRLIPVFPEEKTPYERYASAVFRGADHPDAAALWQAFVQTPECQELAEQCGAYQLPEAEGTELPEELADFSLDAEGSLMEFDFEDAKENGTAYVNEYYAAQIG